MREISCVSSNPHKLAEFKQILAPFGYEVVPLHKPKLEIQADSLEEIASYSLDQFSDINCFVEDAGLFVDDLNGFPGPYSAYVYRTLGCAGVLRLLRNQTSRKAQFSSVIALRNANGDKKIFRGDTVGLIASEERGTGGFGFDPIFVPKGATKTYAEMEPMRKNAVSHRGKAAQILRKYLEK
ncbi:MAG: RdgB/HAM1 family non-canonical purine NTP pyrophosphatase [Candidatus Thorarchaeota archaeon]